jgi:hypothetical protein
MLQGSGAKVNKSKIMLLEVLKVLDHMTGKGMIVELVPVLARFWGVLPSQQVHLIKERPDVASPHPHRDVPSAPPCAQLTGTSIQT